MPTSARWRRGARLALVALLGLPLFALLAMNLFLNLGLPFLTNGKPEKFHLSYTFAWSWWPGRVDVYGLAIRGQGRNDQWALTIDHAHGDIDLAPLRDREFRATGLKGKGGSFRYRFRAQEPVDPALDATPPIPGYTNPPDPIPDPKRHPKGPFAINLVGLEVEDLREVWMEDYRFLGSASMTADLVLGSVMSAKAKVLIPDGQVSRGALQPLANTVTGEVDVALSELVRGEPITMESLNALDAHVDLSAMAEDLSFLDFYLQSAPWLELDGKAALAMDATLVDGEFMTGSMMNAATQDLAVGFVAYEIHGDGTARLAVIDTPDGPASNLDVKYGTYTIQEGSQEPLVQGTGFHLVATSPDTALIRPLTSLHVVIDLPESKLPDVQRFAQYLPQDTGVELVSGTGTVTGHIEAWAEDATLTGTVDLIGDEVKARMEGLGITTDLALHANLGHGKIGTGVYDFAGTTFELTDFSLVDYDPEKKREEEATHAWWAKVTVKDGVVTVGAPTYLDSTILLASADSEPFVRIAAQHKSLPGWVQGMLDVPDVRGSARVRLGEDSFNINPFYVAGGQLEVQLRWFRQSTYNKGALYARYGKLSMAVDIDPESTDVHVFDAKDWYTGEKQPKGDTGKEKKEKAPKADRESKQARKDP